MSKHTKEPWTYSGGIIAAGDAMIADARLMSNETAATWQLLPVKTFDEMQGNVERIVACVNALEGIENPADLRKQRDELKAALERFADMDIVGMGNGSITHSRDRFLRDAPEYVAACKQARALLSRCQ